MRPVVDLEAFRVERQKRYAQNALVRSNVDLETVHGVSHQSQFPTFDDVEMQQSVGPVLKSVVANIDQNAQSNIPEHVEVLYEKAKSICERTLLSQCEFEQKLLEHCHSEDDVAVVVDQCLDERVFDEFACAQAIVQREYLAKERTRRAVESLLVRRGFPAEIIQDAFVDVDNAHERKYIQKFIEQKLFSQHNDVAPQNRQKIYASLMRRGYDCDLIEQVFADYFLAPPTT